MRETDLLDKDLDISRALLYALPVWAFVFNGILINGGFYSSGHLQPFNRLYPIGTTQEEMQSYPQEVTGNCYILCKTIEGEIVYSNIFYGGLTLFIIHIGATIYLGIKHRYQVFKGDDISKATPMIDESLSNIDIRIFTILICSFILFYYALYFIWW